MVYKVDLFKDIEKYAKKWAMDPKSRVFAQLADAYRKAGMPEEAIQVCLEGLKTHPNYASARMVLGRAYMEKAAFAEAEGEFCCVIELSPDNTLANRLLGEVYEGQEKWEMARAQYQRALDLNPFDQEAKELLAKLDAFIKVPWEEERELLSPALMEDTITEEVQIEAEAPPLEEEIPGDREEVLVTETLGDLYLHQGHGDRAASIYEQLLSKDPSSEALRNKLEKALSLHKTLQRDLIETLGPSEPFLVPSESPPSGPPKAGVQAIRVFEGWLEGIRKIRESRREALGL